MTMSPIVVISFLCFSSTLGLEKTNSRIIDGVLSSEGQFPYAVAFTYESSGNTSLCGGSLLSTRWVLTAAHCVLNINDFHVYLGSIDINQPSSNGQVLHATEAFPHPSYNPALSLDHNVGLILLPSAVSFTSNIRPINLPSQTLAASQVVTAIGWGATSDNLVYANVQYHVSLNTISNAICRESGFGNQITNNMVCAIGINNQGTCRGDTGGPLTQTGQDDTPVLVGIASFYSETGCEQSYPSGFTRTFQYVEWITNITDTVPDSSFSTMGFANISLVAASVIFLIFSSLNLTF